MCTCSGAKLEHSSFVLCSLPVAQQACVAPWRDLQAFRSVAQWKGSRCRSARQPYQQPGCVAMVTKFEQCLALSNSLSFSLFLSSSYFLSFTSRSSPLSPLHPIIFSLTLSLNFSPFLFPLSLFLSILPLTPPTPHTHSITAAANGTAPSNQTRLHNELVMQRPVVAEPVLQHPSRQISFMHKKKKEGERERERKKEGERERESKLKIVDGGWGGDGGAKSKEAEPPLRATAKTR